MWWPLKAGSASRATNFLVGFKRNHRYSGKPFYDNKKSPAYQCNLIKYKPQPEPEPEPEQGGLGSVGHYPEPEPEPEPEYEPEPVPLPSPHSQDQS